MNVISLTGRLVKDNELKYTNNNKSVLSNTIAVKKDKKDENGNYESDFIDVVMFERKADYINNYTTKGDLIEIIGKLRSDKWQDKEGNWHSKMYIVADKVEILSRKKKSNESTKTNLNITDEDLPF